MTVLKVYFFAPAAGKNLEFYACLEASCDFCPPQARKFTAPLGFERGKRHTLKRYTKLYSSQMMFNLVGPISVSQTSTRAVQYENFIS